MNKVNVQNFFFLDLEFAHKKGQGHYVTEKG